MSGHCVQGKHDECPDSREDTYACSCPCHIDTAFHDLYVMSSQEGIAPDIKLLQKIGE